MPLEVVCDGCGAVLYSGMELKYAGDILRRVGGVCSKCGQPLSTKDFTVDVQPL